MVDCSHLRTGNSETPDVVCTWDDSMLTMTIMMMMMNDDSCVMAEGKKLRKYSAAAKDKVSKNTTNNIQFKKN